MKFLLVRLGAMGDIVHAVPVATAMRRAWPDAQIDWVVSAKHRAVLDLVPAVNRRIVVADRSRASDGLSLPAAISALRRERYDVAIDLQGLMKSALVARLSGARRVIGFSRTYAREPLASLFYTDRYNPGGAGMFDPTETRHVVRINLGVLSVLALSVGEPEFGLEAPRSAQVDEVTARVGGHYALLNTGAAWPNKRWPPDRLAAVARWLRDTRQLSSIVLWGPGERGLAEDVVAQADGAAVLAPETSIADIAALAKDAVVMVSGDTGPTHIAGAMGTPLVGIYGPTRPERNGPLGHDDESVSRAGACQCHHLRQCRLDRMCLLDIEVSEVCAAVDRRLRAAESSRG